MNLKNGTQKRFSPAAVAACCFVSLLLLSTLYIYMQFVYVSACSDFAIPNSVIILLESLQILLSALIFAGCYSFLVEKMLYGTKKQIIIYTLLILIIDIYENAGYTALYISTANESTAEKTLKLSVSLVSSLLSALILVIACRLAIHLVIKKFNNHNTITNETKIFSFNDPVSYSSFLCCAVASAVILITKIGKDISILSAYAYSFSDILLIIVECLFIAAVYMVGCHWLINKLTKKLHDICLSQNSNT